MLKSRIFAAVVTLGLCASALAQTSQPVDSPEQAKVRAAAKDFIVAEWKDDLTDAKAKFGGTDENFRFVELMHGMLLAAKNLKAAAVKQWPNDFQHGQTIGQFDYDAILAKLDKTPIDVKGDTANIHGGSMELKKINGQWKVVDLMNKPDGKAFALKMVGALQTAIDATTAEIDKGAYPNYSAAEAALGDRLKQAVASVLKPSATKPSN